MGSGREDGKIDFGWSDAVLLEKVVVVVGFDCIRGLHLCDKFLGLCHHRWAGMEIGHENPVEKKGHRHCQKKEESEG